MAQITDYGSPVFAGWRAAAGETWQRYVDHEFVRGLGDGSLPQNAFIHYLIQDYIFLQHFSRAWALAVVKAESVSQMRVAAATVNALINEEVQLHVAICAREGISETDLESAAEEPDNLAYTRYVMDAGLSGDLLDLLATLAPCVFGYGEIGLRLAESSNTLPAYREWIDTYQDQEYQSVCAMVAQLIEETAAQKLGTDFSANPRWPALCKRFTIATDLEVNFWELGLRLGRDV
ncbi:MAG: thiaminase II [Granulosicoccus sp.]|nr:thiaminase II [Granulosicoccus sp.]